MMNVFKLLMLITLLHTSIYAKKVALLVETASGDPIYSEKDIRTMKKLLGKEYNITVINTAQATAENIRTHLQDMSELNSTDIFVFYYSGHGARFSKGDSEEADRKDDFLVTHGLSCINNVIKDVLIDDELNYLYANIPAKKVIIIDACHSHTMYKNIPETTKKTKLYKGCDIDYPLKRGFPIDSKWLQAHPTNIIHLGAANENESAEGSEEGGIFTLALKKALKEVGNVSFLDLLPTVRRNIKPIASRLDAVGAFKPSFKIIDSTLTTKDIFVLPKPRKRENSLQNYLTNHKGGIELRIHEKKNPYSLNSRIELKATVANSHKNYYLIDMLDKNKYKVLTKSTIDQCIKHNKKRYCQFTNLIATAPFGESNLYMLITSKALSNTVSQTDQVLKGDALEKELKKMSIKVGEVSFEVYE